jgi:hypothetical protein
MEASPSSVARQAADAANAIRSIVIRECQTTKRLVPHDAGHEPLTFR